MDLLQQLSSLSEERVRAATPRLAHIGGHHLGLRTALVWKQRLVLAPAREAQEGETVNLLLSGSRIPAQVRAWDQETGLTVLELNEGPEESEPSIAPRASTGALWLVTAYPSEQGVEAALGLVRFAGQSNEGIFQTDTPDFPGFWGAVAWNADGAWAGWQAASRKGNSSWFLGADHIVRLASSLLERGSRRRVRVGVSVVSGEKNGRQGLLLSAVEAGSLAAQAGWKVGDWLFQLAGKDLRQPSDLWLVLGARFRHEVLAWSGFVGGTEASGELVASF